MNRAQAAAWPSGLTYISAMQNEPVMCVGLKAHRNIVLDGALDCVNIAPRRNACSVSDPENMGVDGLGRMPERGVQHHIRRFSSDTGKAHQCGAAVRDGSIIIYVKYFG